MLLYILEDMMSKMKDLFSSTAIPMGKEIKAMLKEHGDKVAEADKAAI